MKRWLQRTFAVRRPGVEIAPEEIFPDAVNSPGFRVELAEGRIERPIGRRAYFVFAVFLAVGLITVAARLAYLQVVRGEDLLARARANKTYPILLAAPRGIFYDRNGEKLVENTPTFVITIRPREFSGDGGFFGALTRLASLTGRSTAAIAEDNGLDPATAASAATLLRSMWPEEAFVAAGELREAILEIQARPDEFPAVAITEAARRSYVLGAAASHVLGYVGLPSREDLASRSPTMRSADVIGKAGLEAQYEEILAGRAGEKLIEVDAGGAAIRERFIMKSDPGQSVMLELDAGLQRFAAATLERHLRALGKRAGAVVAMDPRDGAVRALVSYPSFDSNIFGRSVPRKDFERLKGDPAHPFFNRAVSGGYPSGSTIKPLLAVAALEEGVIEAEREIYDPGYLSVPNPYDPEHPTIFKDWKELGIVDMRRAIALSANVYFYTIGGGYRDIRGLGIERIKRWLERFGWGRALGIDLPAEYAGLVPDPELKKAIRPKDPVWRLGDTYITAIGQGDVQATPLQLAASIAAIANGGTLWKPRLASAVVGLDGETVREFRSEFIGRDIARAESLTVVREGMRQAVTAGSAAALADLPFAVAGKTGTAQTGAYGKNHGWFVGFAPSETPELVIAVLVEEGTGGSTDAVPIAKEVLYYYFTEAR